jgi:hypothetical protein
MSDGNGPTVSQPTMGDLLDGLNSCAAKDVLAACTILAKLSRDTDWKESAYRNGAVLLLLRLIPGSNPTDVRQQACRCLFNLSVLEGVRAEIMRHQDSLQTLLTCVSDENEQLRLNAVGTLANMATNKGNKSILVELGALKALITLMRMTDNDRILQHVCRALFALAADDEIKTAVVQSGGLLPLIRCLRSNSTHVQWHASGEFVPLSPPCVPASAIVLHSGSMW